MHRKGMKMSHEFAAETLNAQQIDAMIKSWEINDLIEDRLEYSIIDMMQSYLIDEQSARALQIALHAHCNDDGFVEF